MSFSPDWSWNELQQVGTDYADVVEVQRYEQRMRQFRNLDAEDAAILETLALRRKSHLLEIGTGTGHFARAAARAGYRVTALDVSPAMLLYAGDRARSEGVTGIDFRRAGFLTYDGAPGMFDAAVSVIVLHHLPDLWKTVALHNVNRWLKPGGRFLLRDVVFSSKCDLNAQFSSFVGSMPKAMREGAAGHIAKEFSTVDWIMEGLLTQSRFRICRIDDTRAPIIQYLCETSQAAIQRYAACLKDMRRNRNGRKVR